MSLSVPGFKTVFGKKKKPTEQEKAARRAEAAAKDLKKGKKKILSGQFKLLEEEHDELADRLDASKAADPNAVKADALRIEALSSQTGLLKKNSKGNRKKAERTMGDLGKELIAQARAAKTGASPEEVGRELADRMKALADGGNPGVSRIDARALDHLVKTAPADSDDRKSAVAAVARLAQLNQEKAKAEGPSQAKRTAPRVPNEVVVQLAANLKSARGKVGGDKAKETAIDKVSADARRVMMEHKLTVADTKSFLDGAKADFKKAGLDDLAKTCRTLKAQVPANDADIPATRQNEALYGRVYDSALISDLVKSPPVGVQGAMKDTGVAFGAWLKGPKVKPEHVEQATEAIQEYLRGESDDEDPRFWLDKVPGLTALRDARSKPEAKKALEDFLAADKTTGADCVALPWLMVKLGIKLDVAARLDSDDPEPSNWDTMSSSEKDQWYRDKPSRKFAGCPWMLKGNSEYQVLAKQKSNMRPGGVGASDWKQTDSASDGSGITLKHQPSAVNNEGYTASSTRPTTQNVPHLNKGDDGSQAYPTEGIKTALEHGLPYASGVSGSTNIMLHTLEHLNKNGAKIDAKDYLLGTAMFLVHDGGHSMQEILWTANLLDNKLALGIGMPGGAKPEDYVADYDHFVGLYGATGTGAELKKASDSAWNRVTDYFDEHSYYSESGGKPGAPKSTGGPSTTTGGPSGGIPPSTVTPPSGASSGTPPTNIPPTRPRPRPPEANDFDDACYALMVPLKTIQPIDDDAYQNIKDLYDVIYTTADADWKAGVDVDWRKAKADVEALAPQVEAALKATGPKAVKQSADAIAEANRIASIDVSGDADLAESNADDIKSQASKIFDAVVALEALAASSNPPSTVAAQLSLARTQAVQARIAVKKARRVVDTAKGVVAPREPKPNCHQSRPCEKAPDSPDKFYHEQQTGGRCGIHAANAFFGKEVVKPGALTESVNTQADIQGLVLGDDASEGNDPGTLVGYLAELAEEGTIDATYKSIRLDSADASNADTFDNIAGDRMIVGQGVHFIAFRKTTDGKWYRIDSQDTDVDEMKPSDFIKMSVLDPGDKVHVIH